MLEFAFVAPVFVTLLLGVLNIGQMVYGKVLLPGAVTEAARSSTFETANTTTADAKVKRIIDDILPGVTVKSKRTSYYDFPDVSRPEKWNDKNKNGTCDASETYTDENKSGHWEPDVGKDGNGGANDTDRLHGRSDLQAALHDPLRAREVDRNQDRSLGGQEEPAVRIAGPNTAPLRGPAREGKRRLSCRRLLAALWANRSGVAMIEFALVLPVLMALGMYGLEIAYMASVDMQISQIAVSVADNASRMEQTNNSGVTPTVTEADIDSVMDGAIKQGESFNLSTNGRVVLTSLEKDTATTKQYIHWQRCRGTLAKSSSYGNATTKNGLTGTPLPGMGPPGKKITAASGSAVMYAEVYYKYTGIFGDMFVKNKTFKGEAAFLIRDVRNLTAGVTGTGAKSPCCSTYPRPAEAPAQPLHAQPQPDQAQQRHPHHQRQGDDVPQRPRIERPKSSRCSAECHQRNVRAGRVDLAHQLAGRRIEIEPGLLRVAGDRAPDRERSPCCGARNSRRRARIDQPVPNTIGTPGSGGGAVRFQFRLGRRARGEAGQDGAGRLPLRVGKAARRRCRPAPPARRSRRFRRSAGAQRGQQRGEIGLGPSGARPGHRFGLQRRHFPSSPHGFIENSPLTTHVSVNMPNTSPVTWCHHAIPR